MNRNRFICYLLILVASNVNAKHLTSDIDSLNQNIRNEGSPGFQELISKLTSSKFSEKVNRCPEGWIFEGQACFYVNTDKSKMNLTWVSAQGECDEMGGYLAEPATEVVQEFLYSILKIIEGTGQRSNWWIGLSDISHEGNWYWQYNEMALSFSSWMIGRPNSDSPNIDDCVFLYSDDHSYDWLDVHCDDPASNSPVSFICQKINDGATTTTVVPTGTTTAPNSVTTSAATTNTATPMTTTRKITTSKDTVIVTSDGLTDESPHCSWSSDCEYTEATKDKCADALCKAQGFGEGVCLDSSNNFCTESFTDDECYVFYVDTNETKYIAVPKEAQITAVCQREPFRCYENSDCYSSACDTTTNKCYTYLGEQACSVSGDDYKIFATLNEALDACNSVSYCDCVDHNESKDEYHAKRNSHIQGYSTYSAWVRN